MKRILFAIAVVLLLFNTNTAQQYQTVNSGRIPFFNFENGLYPIKIKQVAMQNADSLFTVYRVIKDTATFPGYGDTTCDYDLHYPCWAGNTVIIKPNGNNCIINAQGDTFFIHTRAANGECWNLHQLADKRRIQACVQNCIFDTIGSCADSIKIIVLQMLDSLGNPLAHAVNGKELYLGKNYGLLKAYDWRVFPDMVEEYIFAFNNIPTYKEIYDIDTGTIMHFHEYPVWGMGLYQRYVLKKYLTKTLVNDSVIYQCYTCGVNLSINYTPTPHIDTSFVCNHTTEKYKYSDQPFVSFMPKEFSKNYYFYYSMFGINAIHTVVLEQTFNSIRYDSVQDCGQYPFEWDANIVRYSKGFGLIYEYWWPHGATPGSIYELSYFKKGDMEQGTPFVFLGEKKIAQSLPLAVRVYPNPTSDFFMFQILGAEPLSEALVTLYDCYGRVVLKKNIREMKTPVRIDVGEIPSGMYLLEIESEKGFYKQRIVVKP